MKFSPKSLRHNGLNVFVMGAVVCLGMAGFWNAAQNAPRARTRVHAIPASFQPALADHLDGGVAWLNTAGPIKLRELKGKIVVLDFWTFCCINCHHVLPDLAKLEEKYKNEIVVIGVHTPKFVAERDVANVRQKVREYGIKHPVVCDSDQVIWNHFGVSGWPTVGVFDPEGKVAFAVSGEGHFAELDKVIGDLVAKYKGKGLDETPVRFFPENEKPDLTPLLYPGKILADADSQRLFISDTGHNRIVMTDLAGKNPVLIGDGTATLKDGGFAQSAFHRPQGMTLVGETLYVADTENHAIRAVDLKAKTVSTVAGTGLQGQRVARGDDLIPTSKKAINSPWDLAHIPGSKVLYVAMAGPHQIWKFDTETKRIGVFAGTGNENIVDGPAMTAAFAQPSGLATDGTTLYVADSEVSALRAITLVGPDHSVKSIVGEGLFEFGDIDGQGKNVRLQHCLGVAFADGVLYVADTYNNKIKACDPKTREVKTYVGTGKPGEKDSPAEFYQPGGLSVAGKTLYVADTNNHKVRAVDLETKNVKTIDIIIDPPASMPRKPLFLNVAIQKEQRVEVAPGMEFTLDVTVPIPSGFKLNAEGSMPYLVETPGKTGLIKFPESGMKLEKPERNIPVNVELTTPAKDKETLDLKLSVSTFICSEGSSLCTIKSYVWPVRVTFAANGKTAVAIPLK